MAMQKMLTVRPEIAESTLRLLDKEAEHWRQATQESTARFGDESDDAVSYRKLNAALASAAKAVRAGEAFDVSTYWDGPGINATASFLELAVCWEINHQIPWDDGSGIESRDWRYISDLAALVADIECVRSL